MSFEIISPFKATVFGNKVNDEAIYHTLNYVYNIMLNKPEIFDESKINYKEFFEDLIFGLESNEVQFYFAQEDIQDAVRDCLRYAKKFEEIQFWVYESDYGFESMNEKIKNGAYLLKNA